MAGGARGEREVTCALQRSCVIQFTQGKSAKRKM
jgi:hypothetical protein